MLKNLFAIMALSASATLAHAEVAKVEVLESARALLPASIRDKGKLDVAGSMVWPPYQWVDDKDQITGFEPDFTRLISAKLGLEAAFDNVKFASIMPSLANGRYDVAIGELGLRRSRLETVDLVPTGATTLGLLTAHDNSALQVKELCGKSLAATLGSLQLMAVEKLTKDCVDSGQQPITVIEFADTPSSSLAVANHRADGFIITRAPGAYMAAHNPQLGFSDSTVEGWRWLSGFMINKNSTELRAALTEAVISTIEDGSYQALLAQYGIDYIAITPEEVRFTAEQIVND